MSVETLAATLPKSDCANTRSAAGGERAQDRCEAPMNPCPLRTCDRHRIIPTEHGRELAGRLGAPTNAHDEKPARSVALIP